MVSRLAPPSPSFSITFPAYLLPLSPTWSLLTPLLSLKVSHKYCYNFIDKAGCNSILIYFWSLGLTQTNEKQISNNYPPFSYKTKPSDKSKHLILFQSLLSNGYIAGMQSPVYGFPSGTAFSYGRGMPLPFYQPFYQNSYFSSTLRSPTRPRFSAAPTPASPNVQTSPAGTAGTSLPVVCKPDQFSPDHHADDLASKIRSLNI